MAWIFVQRLAGHRMARIARALNDAAAPCPSAADPERNPHRSGNAWTLHTVRAILRNPRYTGRQVWTRRDPTRPRNAYIREDQILPRLPALGILIGAPARSSRKQGAAHSPVPAGAVELISHLRAQRITLIYDPGEHALRAGTHSPASVTIDREAPTARG